MKFILCCAVSLFSIQVVVAKPHKATDFEGVPIKQQKCLSALFGFFLSQNNNNNICCQEKDAKFWKQDEYCCRYNRIIGLDQEDNVMETLFTRLRGETNNGDENGWANYYALGKADNDIKEGLECALKAVETIQQVDPMVYGYRSGPAKHQLNAIASFFKGIVKQMRKDNLDTVEDLLTMVKYNDKKGRYGSARIHGSSSSCQCPTDSRMDEKDAEEPEDESATYKDVKQDENESSVTKDDEKSSDNSESPTESSDPDSKNDAQENVEKGNTKAAEKKSIEKSASVAPQDSVTSEAKPGGEVQKSASVAPQDSVTGETSTGEVVPKSAGEPADNSEKLPESSDSNSKTDTTKNDKEENKSIEKFASVAPQDSVTSEAKPGEEVQKSASVAPQDSVTGETSTGEVVPKSAGEPADNSEKLPESSDPNSNAEAKGNSDKEYISDTLKQQLSKIAQGGSLKNETKTDEGVPTEITNNDNKDLTESSNANTKKDAAENGMEEKSATAEIKSVVTGAVEPSQSSSAGGANPADGTPVNKDANNANL